MNSIEAAEKDQRDAHESDAAAVRAGADVEVPAAEPETANHTTRTLSDADNDADNGDAAENFPLTTDEQAQDEDSIVNPESS